MARSPVLAITFALGLFTASPGASPAAAQETALLKGVVADDATGALIRSATVMLVGSETKTKTGEDGTFVFAEAPLGRVLVRVQAEGYPAVVEETEVSLESANVLPVFLQSAVAALDGIIAFGTPTQPVEKTAKSAAELLSRKIPEIQAYVNKLGNGRFPTRLVLRGRNTMGSQQDSEPMIVLDGVRMEGGIGYAVDLLKQIPATNVKRMQIIRGSTGAFLYGAPDGVIVVETFGLER